jgi:hypothetical protein
MLEALDRENLLSLTSVNKKQQTPLHISVTWRSEATEFLLEKMLGELYVHPDERPELVKPRTEQDQQMVEEKLLGALDENGRSALHAAAESFLDENNLEVLLRNLLGASFIRSDGDTFGSGIQLNLARRLLLTKDRSGVTVLHYVCKHGARKMQQLRLLLRNLLGDDYVDETRPPAPGRDLQTQIRIAELLQVATDKSGMTPLHCTLKWPSDACELLLRNLLGHCFNYPYDPSGRVFRERSPPEMYFAHRIFSYKDKQGQTPSLLAESGNCSERVRTFVICNIDHFYLPFGVNSEFTSHNPQYSQTF